MRSIVTYVAIAASAALGAGCGGNGSKGAEEPRRAGDPDRVRSITEQQDDEADEVDDGVRIEGQLGRLEPSQITAVVERHADALQSCYLSNLGGLKYLGGRVELKFRAAADGTVMWVRLAESTVGAWPVEKCLVSVARAMKFPKPKGGEAEFGFPMDFSGNGKVETLDEDLAQAQLDDALAALAACDGSAAAAPSQVQVTVYVGPGGAVTSAGFGAPGVALEDAWGDCAQQAAMTWKLTDPRGRINKLTGWYR